jgi:hypothetical protein
VFALVFPAEVSAFPDIGEAKRHLAMNSGMVMSGDGTTLATVFQGLDGGGRGRSKDWGNPRPLV